MEAGTIVTTIGTATSRRIRDSGRQTAALQACSVCSASRDPASHSLIGRTSGKVRSRVIDTASAVRPSETARIFR